MFVGKVLTHSVYRWGVRTALLNIYCTKYLDRENSSRIMKWSFWHKSLLKSRTDVLSKQRKLGPRLFKSVDKMIISTKLL